MAKEAHDELGVEVELLLRLITGTKEAVEARLELDAAAGMSLRVEEDFGMYYAVGGGLGEIGPGHVEEIYKGDEERSRNREEVRKRKEDDDEEGDTEE